MANVSQKTADNKPKMSKKTKDYIFVALMLLIPVIHFIIFWGVVNWFALLILQKF